MNNKAFLLRHSTTHFTVLNNPALHCEAEALWQVKTKQRATHNPHFSSSFYFMRVCVYSTTPFLPRLIPFLFFLLAGCLNGGEALSMPLLLGAIECTRLHSKRDCVIIVRLSNLFRLTVRLPTTTVEYLFLYYYLLYAKVGVVQSEHR